MWNIRGTSPLRESRDTTHRPAGSKKLAPRNEESEREFSTDESLNVGPEEGLQFYRPHRGFEPDQAADKDLDLLRPA